MQIWLRLSSLTIGVTPVAFGFTSSLILNYTRDTRLVSRLAHIALRTRRCIDKGFSFCGFSLNSLCFFGF